MHRRCADHATTDIARTRQHYERLGFTANVIDNFMLTRRDDIELFFSVPVADSGALHVHWQGANIPGLRPLRKTDYNVREFAYVDPDGNMILFESRLS